MKRIFSSRALAFVGALFLFCLIFVQAFAEETAFYVTANLLNGRLLPNRHASIEAFFDHGDCLEGTGNWSKDHLWVEVVAGENGVAWCDIRYLTERTDSFKVRNYGRKPVKIRSHPVNGRIVGYLKPNKTLTISRVVLGWGRCKSGWIDLECVIEEEE